MDSINHIEENFFAVCRYWGSLNSSLMHAGSIGAMNTGVAISDINWVWNEKPLTNDDAKTIADIKKNYQKLNLPFWWWIYPCGQSPETGKMLQNAGLRLVEKVPCMAAELNNPMSDKPIPDNVTISAVQDKNDLLLWEDISFHGFEMPPHAREQYGTFVSSFELNAQSPQKLFLVFYHGKAIATSLLFTHRNSAGIYYVSTLHAYRHKGFGLMITQAAMQVARELGFKDVILQATPLGAQIYRRAGFKEYYRADVYTLSIL
jgi:GNAT superfamily N-acetyltransferase